MFDRSCEKKEYGRVYFRLYHEEEEEELAFLFNVGEIK